MDRRALIAAVYQSLRAPSLGGCRSFTRSMPRTWGALTRIQSMLMVRLIALNTGKCRRIGGTKMFYLPRAGVKI